MPTLALKRAVADYPAGCTFLTTGREGDSAAAPVSVEGSRTECERMKRLSNDYLAVPVWTNRVQTATANCIRSNLDATDLLRWKIGQAGHVDKVMSALMVVVVGGDARE